MLCNLRITFSFYVSQERSKLTKTSEISCFSFVAVARDVVIVVLSQEDQYHASLAQQLRSTIQQQAEIADQVGVCIRSVPENQFTIEPKSRWKCIHYFS
jgi:hypothetical protein